MEKIIIIVLASLCGCTTLDKAKEYYDDYASDKDTAVSVDHGRLIQWHTSSGKRVVQYEDGEFEGEFWTGRCRECWDGWRAKYKDTHPASSVDKYAFSHLETRVDSTFDPGGTFVDTGERTAVPDNVHFWARSVNEETGKDDDKYYVEFDYGNCRDAVWSGNGKLYMYGPEGLLLFSAQCRGDNDYKGMKTCLR